VPKAEPTRCVTEYPLPRRVACLDADGTAVLPTVETLSIGIVAERADGSPLRPGTRRQESHRLSGWSRSTDKLLTPTPLLDAENAKGRPPLPRKADLQQTRTSV